MTAAIPPISAAGIATPLAPLTGITSTPAATGTAAGTGASFANLIGQGLAATEQAQSTADSLAVQAATGKLTDVSSYLSAATEASLATQTTVAVANKAVEAFNEIMRLQA